MKPDQHRISRRSTPWDEQGDITPSQAFIKHHHERHYHERHHALAETNEAEFLNSKIPTGCRLCGSGDIKKAGLSANGVQMYQCKACTRKFTVLTGTVFDGHKIPISEWIEYLYNLFSYVSLRADSWNNKNAMTTSRFWLEKVFLLVQEYQKGIVLEGEVTLDETFYSVRTSDLVMREGKKLRGISRNQICIGVACDSRHVFCTLEGYGKPTQRKAYESFKDHIKPGSVLIHDKEGSHRKLVEELGLQSRAYQSAELKKLQDKENPMERVNRIHFYLKRFFLAHSSFDRDSIAGFINHFSFVMNPPKEKLEKVDILINLGIGCSQNISYRELFLKKKANSEGF